MDLPIINLLKKRSQIEIAGLQDEIIEVVYAALPNAVLHGGTAIWRCYNGRRFSMDVDIYAGASELKERFVDGLKTRQLALTKYKETENVIYSVISNGTVEVKLEISKRRIRGTAMPYARADGSKISVITLKPEELIVEKVSAYSNRRLIRDLYDIYYLSQITDELGARRAVSKLIKKIESPVGEGLLETLIYVGAVPTYADMVLYLKRWSGEVR